VALIHYAIYQQEEQTGVPVIPEADRKRIDSGMGLANALADLLGQLAN
jgi:hypothetical protein